MTTLCICCGKLARDPHHPWPKSQGGADEGEVPACRDCHSLYHSICGQQLAKTVRARVVNLGMWMALFPSCRLGDTEGPMPARMAPGFVIGEATRYRNTGELVGLSGDRLSTLGKVKQFKPRRSLGRLS